MELQHLPTAALQPNDYNFNEMSKDSLDELAGEVRRRGFLMHHIVARQEGEGYIIIDGEHQWKAAQMAGLETVPVQVVQSTTHEAIAESYRRNGLRGDTNRLKLARAILRMQAEAKASTGKTLSMVKTANMLAKSDKWVATTLQFAQLADLAAGKENFPTEAAIGKFTEEHMKEWLAFATGIGPNPDGGAELALISEGEGGEGGESQPKPSATDEEKARKVMESVILKVSKMSMQDRSLVARAIKRFDAEDKKAAEDKKTVEPQLAV